MCLLFYIFGILILALPILSRISKVINWYYGCLLYLISTFLISLISSIYCVLFGSNDAHKVWIICAKLNRFFSKHIMGLDWKVDIDRTFATTRKQMGPFIVVANHQSAVDFLSIGFVSFCTNLMSSIL